MKSFYKFFSKLYEFSAKRMCRECFYFIKKGDYILDLGCGSGIVASEFKKFFGTKIEGVDIVDKRVIQMPFTLYDGKNIPLSDNSFDVVLINFVLHHCEDPIKVLSEAKRVAKGKIIIYEDLPENVYLKFICDLHGKSFAWLFRNDKESCNFKKDAEWKEAFRKMGLKLIFEKNILPWSGRKSKMFVLEK
jgi:ubiquinone/menaquinone biosynthesis C-methylase UbiE